MSWEEIQIGDFGRVITGNTPPKKNQEYYGNDFKFIKPTDMQIGRRFTPETEECYSYEGFKKYEKSLIPPLSTCVVTIGSIGKKMTMTEEESFVNQAVNAVIPNQSKFDPYFVFYALKNILPNVRAADTGASSGRENVSKSNFSGLKLKVPTDKKTQHKIASILSAYDDLIENNLKLIKLLEEAAQNIYKEWFVHFRFPGFEQMKFGDGGLPKGWERKSILEFCKVNDKSIKKSNAPDSIGYIDISSTGTGFTDSPLMYRFNDAPSRARRIVSHGDTIFSTVRPNRKTYALILDPIENLIVSTGFAVLSPISIIESPFIYLTVSNQEFIDRISMIAKGAAYPAVSQSDFEQFEILVPDNSIINDLYYLIDPIFRQKNILLNQNQTLKEARDILLPRLMDRRIEV